MSIDQYPAAANDAALSPSTIAPPFRRPLKTFMEEARLAAEQGLKSTVSITPAGLVLTLERPGAGQADNLLVAPPVQGTQPGQPAPKPWR
jgi:hypothetical protein